MLDASLGDSGKSKLAAYYGLQNDIKHYASGATGPNGGHDLGLWKGKPLKLKQLPSGVVVEDSHIYIGPGTPIDLPGLEAEVSRLTFNDETSAVRVHVDYRSGLVDAGMKQRELEEGLEQRGPMWEEGATAALSDYLWRRANLMGEVVQPSPLLDVTDVPMLLNAVAGREHVLIHGTHAPAYSLYSGTTYPLVTSAECTAAGIVGRLGLAIPRVAEVVGVINLMPTTTMAVDMKHELSSEEADSCGLTSFGAVSGIRRRVASRFDVDLLDWFVTREAPSWFALGRGDVHDPAVRGATSKSQITRIIGQQIDFIEDRYQIPVRLMSTGPNIYDAIDMGA